MGFWTYFKSRKRRQKEKEAEEHEAEVEALTQKIRKNRVYFLKQKLKRLKEKQEEMALEDEIADLEDEIYDEDEEDIDEEPAEQSPEALFTGMLTQAIAARAQGNKQNIANINSISSDVPVLRSLNEEELRAYKEKIPKANLEMAKRMNEADLIPIVSEQLQGCDDATIARAIKILKE